MRCWNGANCEKTINYERITNNHIVFYHISGNLNYENIRKYDSHNQKI